MTTNTLELAVLSDNKSSPLITSSIFKQFGFLALPAILGMLINGMYSFVDALFISQGIGANAMAAVSSVFPIQMFLISISTMLGSGMASLIARYLGAKRQRDADIVFSTSFLLSIICAFIFCLFTFLALDHIYELLAVPLTLRDQASSYITPIIIFWVIGFISNQITEGFRASGNPKAMMQVLSTASILNIILDALFIFVFEWDVAGAAWATIIAVSLGLMMAIALQKKGESAVSFSFKNLTSPIKIHFKILSLGLPVLLSHGGFSITIAVTVYSISTVFIDVSEPLIAAHGILVRCFMFLFLPIIGMMVALQTLSGYNFGAKQYQRVKQAYLVAIAMSATWGVVVTGILCFYSDTLLAMFTSNANIIKLGANIAPICFSGFITASFCMMSSGLFQGLGKALPATLLDAARTYVLLLPLMYFLPSLIGPEGLWFAFPIADITGGLFAFIYSLIYLNRLIKHST
ncbi:MATE family efflux transporter [Pseudoalteromonas tunicata]|jgi:putative MATE family efflux protein|uniref:Multidrug export protein MepA n=1 Tax=Pseudoalteromonas tunicata D2 TaxID=87626 RepID=A4C9I0_9GAMM|nr:MATE family efflux transporter [Pseudoalteromonas tunicata]ATC94585.1 hypothetical protein PTUN_a2046 [Pseudoalteromonas tunicata]AXT30312.1 MATE family efflux transporter [Pseudoalteromonas tunicata]EAR28038.1 MATE efflux family protein [Pseudoalteromonas tunicata D2]MDP4984452.1 MATE family efflux transporter [Pseudoalteromonas tunicata]MDP5212114.1 MATE family efflux transporter [Pseudoalteromonas tunicata]